MSSPHLSPRSVEEFTPSLSHRTVIIIAIGIIAPPRRERPRRPAGAEDGERQDEEHRQACAVPGARDEVHVVLEYARVVVAQPPLGREAGDDPAEDDARLARVVGDEACVLDVLGEVDLVQGEAFDLGDDLERRFGSARSGRVCNVSVVWRGREGRSDELARQHCVKNVRKSAERSDRDESHLVDDAVDDDEAGADGETNGDHGVGSAGLVQVAG